MVLQPPCKKDPPEIWVRYEGTKSYAICIGTEEYEFKEVIQIKVLTNGPDEEHPWGSKTKLKRGPKGS